MDPRNGVKAVTFWRMVSVRCKGAGLYDGYFKNTFSKIYSIRILTVID